MFCLCGGVIQCAFKARTFSKSGAKIQKIFWICKFWREKNEEKMQNICIYQKKIVILQREITN